MQTRDHVKMADQERLTSAFRPKPDIRLRLSFMTANDPKRTFLVDMIRLQMQAKCSLLNYAKYTGSEKAKADRKTVQSTHQL